MSKKMFLGRKLVYEKTLQECLPKHLDKCINESNFMNICWIEV